jgi:hypothetical protein
MMFMLLRPIVQKTNWFGVTLGWQEPLGLLLTEVFGLVFAVLNSIRLGSRYTRSKERQSFARFRNHTRSRWGRYTIMHRVLTRLLCPRSTGSHAVVIKFEIPTKMRSLNAIRFLIRRLAFKTQEGRPGITGLLFHPIFRIPGFQPRASPGQLFWKFPEAARVYPANTQRGELKIEYL